MGYSGATLLLLTLLAVWFHRLTVDGATAAAQSRATTLAGALSVMIDTDALSQADAAEDDEATRALRAALLAIASRDGGVSELTVTRDAADGPRVVGEYAIDGGEARPGEALPPTDAYRAATDAPVADAPRDGTVSAWAPLVTEEGARWGHVGVTIDASDIDAARDRVTRGVLFGYGIGALLIALVTLLTWPRGAAPRTAAAPAPSPAPLVPGEATGLTPRFDLLARQLQEREFIRDTFGRYVSHKVADTLLAGHAEMQAGGEHRDVTVLYVDLEKSNERLARLSPEEAVSLLNDVLGTLADCVDEHGGSVVEFVGDAVLAVFGAPAPVADHAERAVACAITMRERILRVSRDREKNGRGGGVAEPLKIRIGIHCGRVVAGNVGNATRMRYGIIGEPVDVASRLERLNKELGTDILVSETVVQRLPPGRAAVTERGSRPITAGGELRVFSV